MAKRVWVSLPLTTTTDLTDAAVVGFLKGGKKTLEIETGAFITKWLMDKSVPFNIDFESSTVDRTLVMAALPSSLQKSLGSAAAAPSVLQTEPSTPVEASAAELPTMVELAPVENQVDKPVTTEVPAPMELPAAEPAMAELVHFDDPAAEPTALMEPVSAEIPATDPAAVAEPAAPAATGELAVPEEQEAGSKRASRLRVKRPKAGPPEVA